MSLAAKRGIAFADLPARLAGRRQNAVGSVLLLAPLNSLSARRCSGVCVWCRRKRHRIDLRRRRHGSRRADRGPRRQRLRPDRFDRRLLARRGQLNGRRRGWIGAAAGLCERRDEAGAADCGFGLAAAAAAAPGRTGPVGSGFMMLTAGIEAAVGKSMLTILRGPDAFAGAAGAAAWTCGASATAGSDALAQIGK